MKQDTIYNSPALNISLLADVQLNKLPEATGVVVVHGLGVAKGFHDGAALKNSSFNRGRLLLQGQVQRLLADG